MDFPKKQQQSLIPKYLLDYLGEVNELHPDPSDLGGGDNIEAGTGIKITGDDVKTISVDDTVAMKTDIPDVSDFITENEVDTKLEDYELKADAFSGSYTDLTDKPDLSVYELKSEAFSGDYDDLTDKPDLSVYELKSEAFSGDYNDLTDKPDLSVYALSSSLASVAITGDYNDLSNKPTIPDTSNFVTTNTDQTITGEKTFNNKITVNGVYLPLDNNGNGYPIYGKYNDNSDIYRVLLYTSGTAGGQHYTNVGNNLSTLIFKSYYRPQWKGSNIALQSDIPTVNNNTITITQGGVTKGTFTLNQNSDSTIALDAGGSSYTAGTGIKITNDVISVDTTTVAMKTDIPTVPTNVSAFTNDAGYITSSALTGYQTKSNLVTSISSQSTNTQYPSAKCVYNIVGNIETLLAAL